MRYRVRVLLGAEEDLFEIFNYVAAKDSPSKARSLLGRLESACGTLEYFPARGRVPPELKSVGVSLYREILLKSYRIIYRVEKRTVYIYAVLDARRDVTDTLRDRLLR